MRPVALLLAVVPACLSDEERRAAPADTSQADEAIVEPCSEGARECLSADNGRVCQGGAWAAFGCESGDACERATGECAKGEHSCLGTLVCNIDCEQGDKDCPKACADGALVSAVDALGDLNDCQCREDPGCWPILCGRLFPWPNYGEISACVTATCAREAATCVGGGVTGAGECVEIRDCLLACHGDVFCAEGCFPTGTATAQTTAAFYYICVRQACGPDPSSSCLFNAQADKCKALWDTCQGPTSPP